MTYRIVKVESKRPKVNKWHKIVTGKLCTLESPLVVGEMGWLLIEGIARFDYGDMLTRFHTSPVVRTEEKAGVLTIETENSVYTLETVV